MSIRLSKTVVQEPYLPIKKSLPVMCSEHQKYDAKTRTIPSCLTCVLLFWLHWSGHRINDVKIGPSLRLR